MALILKVPYEEKDEVKALGAKWNLQLKKWYVEHRKDYRKFIKWILGNKDQVYILCDCFYIVEGRHICFKCGNPTKVIGYGIKKHFIVCNPELYMEKDVWRFEDDEIHIASHIDPLPEEQAGKLKLYRIPLKNDIIVTADIGWGSEDWMIEAFAQSTDLHIDGIC